MDSERPSTAAAGRPARASFPNSRLVMDIALLLDWRSAPRASPKLTTLRSHSAGRSAPFAGYVVSTVRQYSTLLRTSFTGSDPSGMAYSNSIDPGNFHLFFFI